MVTPRIFLLLLILRYTQTNPIMFDVFMPSDEEFTYPLEFNFKAHQIKFGSESVTPCGSTRTAQCYTESVDTKLQLTLKLKSDTSVLSIVPNNSSASLKATFRLCPGVGRSGRCSATDLSDGGSAIGHSGGSSNANA
ncbi:unnamed protein product [Dibothriocephalus latus]|uniref:Integrin alpha-2 domain-containing protein n=1 Tax=Dibothriocephalus latus TaxID=60516 RepID=A0A3P7LWR7_DIBLA|nr:unnamed protein product [Dibothriocephalus latus]